MEFTQIAASLIFLASIILVITGWIDSVIAALLGILMMIYFGVMTDVEAFKIVDWNVIAILLAIWIISGYFGKSGVPDFLAAVILRVSKGNVAVFVTFIGMLAGFVSMLIDNVVVVLMFAPVVFHACRRFKFSAFAPVLFVGLCANFMGTAMLLGDLPPQMLHSVSGIEFAGFIWYMGRPSSFFILCISYIITCAYFYLSFSRKYKGIRMDVASMTEKPLDEYIDIGKRKDELGKLGQTFNEMITRLRDAFQRINQFSIDVSHELKTPLTIIKGGTEVTLRKDRGPEEYKGLLKSHLEEIDRMSRIIDDLLLLSKADTGEMKLNLEEIDLRDFVIDVYMDMKMFAEKKNVQLSVEDIPDTRLRGDELKLRRMLRNIVDNGIKYTPGGGIVEISSVLDDGFVSINVRDTGIGITEDDIRYVFDRFYRADRSRKRESGSGLGLSISKWIAEAHNGVIEVRSNPASGSLFSIKLPISGGTA